MWLQNLLDAIASHPLVFLYLSAIFYLLSNRLLNNIGDMIKNIRKR